jgi:hypothetical protein
MNPWVCALLITVAGGIGGVVNALLTDNGFVLPRRESGVLCPGAFSNILVGGFAAFASWAFYGSGARWITNEVDKRLLKESVKVAANNKALPMEQTEELVEGTPRQVLQGIKKACQEC